MGREGRLRERLGCDGDSLGSRDVWLIELCVDWRLLAPDRAPVARREIVGSGTFGREGATLDCRVERVKAGGLGVAEALVDRRDAGGDGTRVDLGMVRMSVSRE